MYSRDIHQFTAVYHPHQSIFASKTRHQSLSLIAIAISADFHIARRKLRSELHAQHYGFRPVLPVREASCKMDKNTRPPIFVHSRLHQSIILPHLPELQLSDSGPSTTIQEPQIRHLWQTKQRRPEARCCGSRRGRPPCLQASPPTEPGHRKHR